MAAPDKLFNMKNHFWMGNYQRTIHEGSSMKLREEAEVLQAKAFVLRSYVGQGDTDTVADETQGNQPAAIEAVKMLARYVQDPSEGKQVLMQFEEMLGDASYSSNTTLQTVAATAFFMEGDFNSALKAIQYKRNMEQLALATQIHLKMNRLDLAQKGLAELQKMDDDHSLTQLCRAWTFVAMGGSKYQEASYIFEELCQKYGETVPLLNGLAVTQMHLGKLALAEETLLNASGKSNKNPDTLVNMIVCASCLN